MPSTTKTSTLQIIGGLWRGKKIRFPILPNVRPTPNKARETLFNWLQTDIKSATCLELFAGSGILSLEALSRGAKHTTLLDTNKAITKQLTTTFNQVAQTNQYNIIHTNSLNWLNTVSPHPYDLCFIDPPFNHNKNHNLLEQILKKLEEKKHLTQNSQVYYETNEILNEQNTPSGWQINKQQRSGQVFFYLLSHNDLKS